MFYKKRIEELEFMVGHLINAFMGTQTNAQIIENEDLNKGLVKRVADLEAEVKQIKERLLLVSEHLSGGMDEEKEENKADPNQIIYPKEERDEDGWYYIKSKEFPGAFGQGKTLEECRKDWLEVVHLLQEYQWEEKWRVACKDGFCPQSPEEVV